MTSNSDPAPPTDDELQKALGWLRNQRRNYFEYPAVAAMYELAITTILRLVATVEQAHDADTLHQARQLAQQVRDRQRMHHNSRLTVSRLLDLLAPPAPDTGEGTLDDDEFEAIAATVPGSVHIRDGGCIFSDDEPSYCFEHDSWRCRP